MSTHSMARAAVALPVRAPRRSAYWSYLLAGPGCLAVLIFCLLLIRSGRVSALALFACLICGLTLLGFIKPRYLFVATILLLPFEVLYAPEVPLNVQMVLLLTVIGLAGSVIRSGTLPRTPVDSLYLLYLGVLVISILQTYVLPGLEPPQLLPEEFGWRASPNRGWYHLVAILLGLSILYFTVASITTAARLRAAMVAFFSISLTVAGFSVYEAFAKASGWPLVYFSFRETAYASLSRYQLAGASIPRVYGPAGEPLSFGNFLLLPLSLSLALLITGKGLAGRSLILYSTLAASLLALVLTFSTSAWLGALAAICILVMGAGLRRVHRVAIPVVLISVAALLLWPQHSRQMLQSVSETEQQKIEASLGGNVEDFRYLGWRQAYSVILRFPVLGVGLGNEPFWMDNPDLSMGSYNILLSHWVESGALGCGMFLLILVTLMRKWWRARREALDSEQAAIATGCVAALAGCLVSHMAWGGRLTSWEWFLIGLGLATCAVIRGERKAARCNRIRSREVSSPARKTMARFPA